MGISFILAAVLIGIFQLDDISQDMKNTPAAVVTLFLFCIFIAGYETTCG